MLSIVEAHLDEVLRTMPAVGAARTFIGLGGTFTTMAAVEIGLAALRPRPDQRLRPDPGSSRGRVPHVVTERHADRIHNPGLPEARAHTILGGSCAVVAIMRFFGLEEVRISDDDLLDGICAALDESPPGSSSSPSAGCRVDGRRAVVSVAAGLSCRWPPGCRVGGRRADRCCDGVAGRRWFGGRQPARWPRARFARQEAERQPVARE